VAAVAMALVLVMVSVEVVIMVVGEGGEAAAVFYFWKELIVSVQIPPTLNLLNIVSQFCIIAMFAFIDL